MTNKKIERPSKLEFRNTPGTGLEIHANIQFNPDCCEFIMKKGFQPIMKGAQYETQKVISYEPWIQFPDKQWDEMLETVFKEMVDLWNEKYANIPINGTDTDNYCPDCGVLLKYHLNRVRCG